MAVASLVLAAAAVVGCTGADPDGRGEGASVRAFCSALEEFRSAVDAADSTDIAAYVRALQEAADRVSEVGLPDGVGADVAEGFDLTLARIEGLPPNATQDDVAALGDVTEEEQRSLDALEDYIESTCT